MSMGEKNNIPTQNSLVMIIAEERNTLRTLFNHDDAISGAELTRLSLRSRYNPDLNYYFVECEAYKRYGYTADELFEEIEEKYIESGYKPLDELFTFIERI